MKLTICGLVLAAAVAVTSAPQAAGRDVTRAERDSVACALATIWGNYMKNKAHRDGEAITAEYMRGVNDALEKAKAADAYYQGLEEGIMINSRLRQVDELAGFKVDRDKFAYELGKAAKGRNTGFTPVTADNYMNYILADIAKSRKQQLDAKEYIASLDSIEGLEVTPSGLRFLIITEGEGEMPGPDDMVMVNYTGSLPDGTVFNASDPAKPSVFEVNGTIPGFGEGLQKMKIGGKYRLYIPPELGYGSQGVPGVVPPDAVTIFDVELLDLRRVEELKKAFKEGLEKAMKEQEAEDSRSDK